MLAYVARRLAYGFLTIQGVLLLLFVLFFLYAKPLDVARRAVGEKAPPEVLQQWIVNHGYDRPWYVQLGDHYRGGGSCRASRSRCRSSPSASRLA
jgi:ABC-type dipeptide/oligopeptide/nickel transport system permease component